MQSSVVMIATALLPFLCGACSLLNEPRFACNPVRGAGDSQCEANEKCAVADDPQIAECRTNGGNGFADSACQPTGGSDDCTAGWACVKTNDGKGADNLCRLVCRIGMDSDCGNTGVPGTAFVCIPASAALAKYGFCCPRSGC